MAQPIPPKSYDEITRNTVPEPDSSYRPSKDQERAAIEGQRILSMEESKLHARVTEALHSSGLAVAAVTAEIDDTRVTLRGQVSDVAGVGDVVDLVVVTAGT